MRRRWFHINEIELKERKRIQFFFYFKLSWKTKFEDSSLNFQSTICSKRSEKLENPLFIILKSCSDTHVSSEEEKLDFNPLAITVAKQLILANLLASFLQQHQSNLSHPQASVAFHFHVPWRTQLNDHSESPRSFSLRRITCRVIRPGTCCFFVYKRRAPEEIANLKIYAKQ